MKFGIAPALAIALLLASSSLAATLRVPADYASIQGAVDAASSGDTILIAPGTYDGQISCGKSLLTLKGRGKVLITSNSGIGLSLVFASHVLVQNLRFENASIAVTYSSFITVRKCRASGGMHGISVIDSVATTITKCRFENTGSHPIKIDSDDCVVSGNRTVQPTTFSGNYLQGDLNTVEDNLFIGGYYGVRLGPGADSLVTGNRIDAPNSFGIDVRSPLHVTVAENRIKEGTDGIALADNPYGMISRNQIRKVSRYGIEMGTGWHTTVWKNGIKRAGNVGIHTYSTSSTFHRNDLRKCQSFGFYVGGDNSTFSLNRARTLPGGVDLYKSINASGNHFVENDFETSNL